VVEGLLAKDVDHGKTTLLDYIRGSSVAARESGAITQHVGASSVPLKVIKAVCGDLISMFKIDLKIPGLLFIDTPGHEAFTNLRKRGGSIADLAVLIVDINQGVQPQTKEAIEILKTFKVPFIVAANKVDVICNWKNHSKVFVENVKKQMDMTKQDYEKKFYSLLGQISELGFNCNLYTEVQDYKKEVAVVPISSKTGEGIAELLALLAGLSQKFLGNRLEIDEKSGARGTILEIKEEKGMGTTADVILYDGILTSKDHLVIGGLELVETKVKALLEPAPMAEIREKGTSFKRIDKVQAAAGIKILAPNLDKALAGAPVISARNKADLEKSKEKLVAEIESILIETEKSGVIIKCDTLGSLEAFTKMLQDKEVPIKSASVGPINRKDIVQASGVAETDPLNAFILGFNVPMQASAEKLAKEKNIVVITDSVIYKLIEKFEEAIEKKKEQIELDRLDGLTWPAKFRILPGYIFRQSNPAVFGVEILAGKLKKNVTIMDADGKDVGVIKNIENDGKKIDVAQHSEKVALSVKGLTIGRQAKESDELYTSISEKDYRQFKQKKDLLSKAEINVLKSIASTKRKENEMWGV